MDTCFLRFILTGIWIICCVPASAQFSGEGRHAVDVYVASKAHEYRRLEQAARDNFEDGRYAAARTFADEALALQKSLPQINVHIQSLGCLKADCLVKLGSVDEALKMLEEKGSFMWCDPGGLNQAIKLRIQRKEFDKALADCELLKSTLIDHTGECAMQESEIYLAMGDRAKAMAALQKAYDVCMKNNVETQEVRKRFYDLNSKPVDNDIP